MKTGTRGGPGTEFAIQLALYGLDQLGKLSAVVKDLHALGEKEIDVKVGVSEKGLADLKRTVKKAAEAGFARADMVPDAKKTGKGAKGRQTAADTARPQPVALPKSVLQALENVGAMGATMSRLSQATVALTKKGEISRAATPPRNSAQAMRVHSESLNKAVGEVNGTLKQILAELRRRPQAGGGRQPETDLLPPPPPPAVKVPRRQATKASAAVETVGAESSETGALQALLKRRRAEQRLAKKRQDDAISLIREIGAPPSVQGLDNSDELEEELDKLHKYLAKYIAKTEPDALPRFKADVKAKLGVKNEELAEYLTSLRHNIIKQLEDEKKAVDEAEAEVRRIEAELAKAKSSPSKSAGKAPKTAAGKKPAAPATRTGEVMPNFDTSTVNAAFAEVLREFPAMMAQAAATFQAAMQSIPTTIKVVWDGPGGGGQVPTTPVVTEFGVQQPITRAERKARKREQRSTVAKDKFGLVMSLPKSQDAMERVSSDLSAVDGEFAERERNSGGRSQPPQKQLAYPAHFTEDPDMRRLYDKARRGEKMKEAENQRLEQEVIATRILQESAGLFNQSLPEREVASRIQPGILQKPSVTASPVLSNPTEPAGMSLSDVRAEAAKEAAEATALQQNMTRFNKAVNDLKRSGKHAATVDILLGADKEIKSRIGASDEWTKGIAKDPMGVFRQVTATMASERSAREREARNAPPPAGTIAWAQQTDDELIAQARAQGRVRMRELGFDPAQLGREALSASLIKRSPDLKKASPEQLAAAVDAELARTGKAPEDFATVQMAINRRAAERQREVRKTRKQMEESKLRADIYGTEGSPHLPDEYISRARHAAINRQVALPFGMKAKGVLGGQLMFGGASAQPMLLDFVRTSLNRQIEELNKVVNATASVDEVSGKIRPDVDQARRDALERAMERERKRLRGRGESEAAIANMPDRELLRKSEFGARRQIKELKGRLSLLDTVDGAEGMSILDATKSDVYKIRREASDARRLLKQLQALQMGKTTDSKGQAIDLGALEQAIRSSRTLTSMVDVNEVSKYLRAYPTKDDPAVRKRYNEGVRYRSTREAYLAAKTRGTEKFGSDFRNWDAESAEIYAYAASDYAKARRKPGASTAPGPNLSSVFNAMPALRDVTDYFNAAITTGKLLANGQQSFGAAPKLSFMEYLRGSDEDGDPSSQRDRRKMEKAWERGWRFQAYGTEENAAINKRLSEVGQALTVGQLNPVTGTMQQLDARTKQQYEREQSSLMARLTYGGEWYGGEFKGFRQLPGAAKGGLDPDDRRRMAEMQAAGEAEMAARKAKRASTPPAYAFEPTKFLLGPATEGAKALAAQRKAAVKAVAEPTKQEVTTVTREVLGAVDALNNVTLNNLVSEFQKLLVPIKAVQDALAPTTKLLQSINSAAIRDAMAMAKETRQDKRRERRAELDKGIISYREKRRLDTENTLWKRDVDRGDTWQDRQNRRQADREADSARRIAEHKAKLANTTAERMRRQAAGPGGSTADSFAGLGYDAPTIAAGEVDKIEKSMAGALRKLETAQMRMLKLNQDEKSMLQLGGFSRKDYSKLQRSKELAARDMVSAEDMFVQFASLAGGAAGMKGAPSYFNDIKKDVVDLAQSQAGTAQLRAKRASIAQASADLEAAQSALKKARAQDLTNATPEERAKNRALRTSAVDSIVNARGALAGTAPNAVGTLTKDIVAREQGERKLTASIAGRMTQDKASVGILDRLVGKFKSLAMYMGAGTLLYGGWSILRQAYLESRTLEAELTRVQGIIEGQRLSDRLKIEKGVISAAKEYGVAIRDALQITKTFAQSGFSTTDSLKQMRAALTAVQGAGLDPNQATEMLVAVNNVSGGKVGPTEILDRIARVEARAAVTAQDLSVAIQRVGAVATQLQPNMLGDIDALDTVMAATTRIVETTRVSGNQAATSLRFMLSRLAAPDVAKQLQDRYQINLAGRNENEMRPLQDILSDIAAKYESLKSEGKTVEANSLLATFAGARQINAAAALFTNFERFMEIATDAAGAFGDAQSRLALQMETLEFKTRAMQSAFDEMAYSLIKNTGIGDIMKWIVDRMNESFSFVAKAAESKVGSGAITATTGTSALGLALAGGSMFSMLQKAFFGKKGLGELPAAMAALKDTGVGRSLGALTKVFGLLAGGPVGIALRVLLGIVGALAAFKGVRALMGGGDPETNLRDVRTVDLQQIRDSELFREYDSQARDIGLGGQELADTLSTAFQQAQENAAARLGINLSEYRGSGAKTDTRLAYAVEEELLKIVRDGSNPSLNKLYTGNDQETTQLLMNLLRTTSIREQAVSSTYAVDFEKKVEEGFSTLRESMKGAFTSNVFDSADMQRLNSRNYSAAYIGSVVGTEISKTTGSSQVGAAFADMRIGGSSVTEMVTRSLSTLTLNRLGRPITNLAMALDNVADRLLTFSRDDLKEIEEAKRKLTRAGKDVTDENVLAQLRADGKTGTANIFAAREDMQNRAFVMLAREYGLDKTIQMSKEQTAILQNADAGTGEGSAWTKASLDAVVAANEQLIARAKEAGQTDQAARLEAGLAVLRNYQNRPSERAKLPTTEQLSGNVSMRDRLLDILFKYTTSRLETRRYGEFASGVEVEYGGVRYQGLAGTNAAERNLQASTGALQDLAAVQAELMQDIARTRVRMSQVRGAAADRTIFSAALESFGETEGASERNVADREASLRAIYGSWQEENLKPLRQRLAIADDFYARMVSGDKEILSAMSPEDIKKIQEIGAQSGDEALFVREALTYQAFVKYIQQRAGADMAHKMALEDQLFLAERIAEARERELRTSSSLAKIGRDSAARRAEIMGGSIAAMGIRSQNLELDRADERAMIDRRLEGRISVLRQDQRYQGADASAELQQAINQATRLAADERAQSDADFSVRMRELEQDIKDTAFSTVTQNTASIINQANAGLKESLRDWKSFASGEAIGRTVDSVASTVQDRLSNAMVDNLVGPNGIFGKQMQELFGSQLLMERETIIAAHVQGIVDGFKAVGIMPITDGNAPPGGTDPKTVTRNAFKMQAFGMAGNLLGGFAGSRVNMGKETYGQTGASIGTLVGSKAISQMFGFKAAAALGPWGMVIGGVVGGLLGGLFKRRAPKQTPEYSALERIDRNTRETISAIENQTRDLLSLDNRLLNVPASFVSPRYRPIDASGSRMGAEGTGAAPSFTFIINDATDPQKVATVVADTLKKEMATLGTYSNRRY